MINRLATLILPKIRPSVKLEMAFPATGMLGL
jgi:hypothetical protein